MPTILGSHLVRNLLPTLFCRSQQTSVQFIKFVSFQRHFAAKTRKKTIPKRQQSREMKIAVEGCCHGELDAIYNHIAELEQKRNYTVDLLLICGDFQAIRNHQDLQCMAVPQKYRQLGQFHKYYTGQKKAPLLTIVIGGNHEASNYLWELYHGGWLAPNIYFLGHAGCVQVNGIRIAGASGIYKRNDFQLGHFETMPYDNSAIRSIYHIREYNIRRLSLLSSPPIFLSHDWPQSIEQHGDLQGLLNRKPFFRQDINTGQLGSPPLMGLLRTLKPDWWFSAHLHVRFQATVMHDGNPPGSSQQVAAPVPNPDEITIDDEDIENGEPAHADTSAAGNISAVQLSAPPRNSEEIVLSDEEDDVVVPPPPPPPPSETKFLALDKCLPRRQFLEIVDVPVPEASFISRPERGQARPSPRLTYDPEWLAITRAFHSFLSTDRLQPRYPDEEAARLMVHKELEWVKSNVKNKSDSVATGIRDIDDCQPFVMTAPGPGKEGDAMNRQPPWYTNPQTEAFCVMLELDNKINPPPVMAQPKSSHAEAFRKSFGAM